MTDLVYIIVLFLTFWFGLRHLISLIINQNVHGRLRPGQKLCHLTSVLILFTGGVLSLCYKMAVFSFIAILCEYCLRMLIVKSGSVNG